jgi:DNA-binding transcriptional LysR family regulator
VAEGQIDIAIVPAQLRLPEGVTSEAIGALEWRCFGRREHPAFSKWGRKSWSQWPHLAVRVGDSLTSPVNLAAGAAGLERSIAGWVPHFSAIAPILAGSDLLTTLPSIAMAETLGPYRLDNREVPFPIAPLPHAMIWSTGRSSHPEITWLRDRLRPIAKSQFAGLAA